MPDNTTQRRTIVEKLDRALDECWIKVYYQPIVRAASGKICDEEALARWLDPELGLLLPESFVPELEQAGLICRLDLYVVDRVLEKIRQQEAAGLPAVPQSINLSRSDFDSCDIVEEIRTRVDAAGVPRSLINIEITESVIGKDFPFMKAQIGRFRELGFSVWMDDFGSGYSSLDLLQSIRFDLIKFDMLFLQNFEKDDAGRIILNEMVRMAVRLGLDTVCEGVETEAQADFLREIGCAKLQGMFFRSPHPLEEIFEIIRSGKAIGFENPEETEYFSMLSKLNLYDLSTVASDDDESLRRFYETLPMALIEVDGTRMKYTRVNRSYREFVQRMFGQNSIPKSLEYHGPDDSGTSFFDAVLRCSLDGVRRMVDEQVSEDTVVHSMLRRIAVNPVTGTAAVAAAVLSVISPDETRADARVRERAQIRAAYEQARSEGNTYAQIARSLAADYIALYYVDLDTEEFIEYSSEAGAESLAVERHGSDFFASARQDARTALHSADQERFIELFHRERLVRELDEHSNFIFTYRLMADGVPIWVSMKASRMENDSRHIIIGVNNVDAQMRQQKTMERIREEQATYARITALTGDYICIYTVNPETDRFLEYTAKASYEGLGLAKEGEDFFTQAREESLRTICPEDVDMFNAMFRKSKVLEEIAQNGIFSMRYRLMIQDKPRYVSLQAAIVQEKDGPQIIIGINDIDAQARREEEYARTLSNAETRASRDALTGVKNKYAYVDAEQQLDREIEDGTAEFAVSVFDVNGLKEVNDMLGHQAGDQLLRDACKMICDTFKHSPVFRIGGDEFAALSRGQDYESINRLVGAMAARNARNGETGEVVVACGMAKYQKGDACVEDVFRRADAQMYQNKRMLKKQR